MDGPFTSEEFQNQVFKPDGLDRDFLKQHVNTQCIKEMHITINPMLWAIYNNRLDVVKCLIEENADIARDNNVAIRMAALNGRLDIVKCLVENGADFTDTMLKYAPCVPVKCSRVHEFHLNYIKPIEHGPSGEGTAIQSAANTGRLDIIKYFVEKGMDISIYGGTAVNFAVKNRHLDVVKYLVEKGADVTEEDNWAIGYAIIKGYVDIIKYLLSTYIYSEKDIHHYIESAKNEDTKELLKNYRQFSYTKSCK